MSLRVLVVTSEWPTDERPDAVAFLVRRIDALRTHGVTVDVFPFRGAGRPQNYLRARRGVREALRAERYDVVHAHYGQAGLAVVPSPLPFVVTFHGSDLEGIVGARGRYTLSGILLARLSRAVARRADEVILVSPGLARRLPRGAAHHVIPMGVDLAVFSPGSKDAARRKLGLAPCRSLVLFSGHPDVPVKRFDLAKRAVDLLGPHVELVTMTGLAPQAVADHMRACDALVVTARHEGGPITVKEALACGLPVVSTDVGDVRRWITGVDGCVLCTRDDAPTIADGLKVALAQTDRPDTHELARAFDERILAQREIEVYRTAIDRRA